MKPYKIAVNTFLLFCSTLWVFCGFPKMQHIGDFYWWTLIPTSLICIGGWGMLIVVGLMRWFEIY